MGLSLGYSASEINLVIPLHDLFTLGDLAADKKCIINTFLSRFSKSTERPKAKKIPLDSSFKAPDRIILPLTLRNALRKYRRKVFAYLINC